jgi:hypothetical protein
MPNRHAVRNLSLRPGPPRDTSSKPDDGQEEAGLTKISRVSRDWPAQSKLQPDFGAGENLSSVVDEVPDLRMLRVSAHVNFKARNELGFTIKEKRLEHHIESLERRHRKRAESACSPEPVLAAGSASRRLIQRESDRRCAYPGHARARWQNWADGDGTLRAR